MADGGETSPDPGRGGQLRPLADDEREALRRVLALLETAPGHASMISPRAACRDRAGSSPGGIPGKRAS